jgi:glycosyltransferase involved in cell wall biosynthesis
VTTVVTNTYLENLVKSWGCRAFILGFVPGEYPPGESYPFAEGFSVVVVSSFEWDEPLDVIFEAAARLPKVRFYITGDATRAAPGLLAQKPDNCKLTGYLPYEQYVGLIRGADAVLDLVTCDHTLLLGAFEAVSLGTPLITSDWPVLQDYFSMGTVHVPNTAYGIVQGICRAQGEQARLEQEIQQLEEHLNDEWRRKLADLQELLAA